MNPCPRPSAKAVIVRDDMLLVIVCQGFTGEFCILPGGGQENGEHLPDAVKRECLEEIGVEVEVGDLLYVRDCIAKHHEFVEHDPEFHGLELLFAGRIADDAEPVLGVAPDSQQTGVRWLPLETLEQSNLYPKVLRRVLARKDRSKVYLGDVN